MSNPFESPSTGAPARQAQLELSHILFSFEGRTPRRVYWAWTIGSVVAMYGIGIPLVLMVDSAGGDLDFVEPLVILFGLATLWPNLAITVKRWHDRGKSGWMVLVGIIPIIGPLWTFVELGLLRGDQGPNAYGPDPTWDPIADEDWDPLR